MTIKRIFLAEDIGSHELDYSKLDTDVIVHLENGDHYKAHFISLNELVDAVEESYRKKSEMAKRYYWSKNMVIVKDLRREELHPMINDMIDEGDFQLIFEKLSP